MRQEGGQRGEIPAAHAINEQSSWHFGCMAGQVVSVLTGENTNEWIRTEMLPMLMEPVWEFGGKQLMWEEQMPERQKEKLGNYNFKHFNLLLNTVLSMEMVKILGHFAYSLKNPTERLHL